MTASRMRGGSLGWVPMVLGVLPVVLACGSRSEPLPSRELAQIVVNGDVPGCWVDADCSFVDLCQPQRCVEQQCVVEPVVCEDDDPCTNDRCDAASGACVFDFVTVDEDGDGHRRPLPGFEPGEEGACGDDCNDQSGEARPGGTERCDGVDNDCDGVVDNGALYSPAAEQPLLLTAGAELGSAGGLTYSESSGSYGAVFTWREGGARNTFARIVPDVAVAAESVPVTDVNSDTFAGPIVGRGQIFATAWEDRRDEDYEIYFNRLNTRGEKLGPDVRVSVADDFSLRPTLIEVPAARGQEYRLAWEDHRDRGGRIYGQRIDAQGELIDGNVALTPRFLDPTDPALALGPRRIGMIFNAEADGRRALAFRSFGLDFNDPGDLRALSATDPDAATITENDGNFIVAWHDVGATGAPGQTLVGTVLDEQGRELIAPRAITEPAPFVRSHSMVALGDRILLIWAEYRDGGYDLQSAELSTDLELLGPARALTNFDTDAFGPRAAFGPRGEIGVMFTGVPSGEFSYQVYFTRLACDAASFPDPR